MLLDKGLWVKIWCKEELKVQSGELLLELGDEGGRLCRKRIGAGGIGDIVVMKGLELWWLWRSISQYVMGI